MKRTVGLNILFTFLISVIFSGGCVFVHPLEPSAMARYEGFIHDGETTKEEVIYRLGLPHRIYENGRILLYRVYIDKDGDMNLYSGPGSCHVCVLVFGDSGLLERHSVVINGHKGIKTLVRP